MRSSLILIASLLFIDNSLLLSYKVLRNVYTCNQNNVHHSINDRRNLSDGRGCSIYANELIKTLSR